MEDRQTRAARIVEGVVGDNKDDLPLLDSILELLEKTLRRLYIARVLQTDRKESP